MVFVRDSDRDRYHQRENDIERGIQEAEALFPELDICGGVAKQEIEAWILALLGENRSESHSDAKTILKSRHQIDRRIEKVRAIENADFAAMAKDANSLQLWIDRARKALQE